MKMMACLYKSSILLSNVEKLFDVSMVLLKNVVGNFGIPHKDLDEKRP